MVVTSVWVGLPCASTPSTVDFIPPPSTATCLTSALFGAFAAGSYLDLATLSFQVPRKPSVFCAVTGMANANVVVSRNSPKSSLLRIAHLIAYVVDDGLGHGRCALGADGIPLTSCRP